MLQRGAERRRARGSIVARAWRRTRPGRRPGSCRSTASRRRRRRWCGATSRAPAPAKNSAESASITRHCAGLVSCASSTRMWSRPPSSRQSTQAAVPGRASSARARSIRSSKSSSPSAALRGAAGGEPGAGEAVERRGAGEGGVARAGAAGRPRRAASARRARASRRGWACADRLGREAADLGGERRCAPLPVEQRVLELLEPQVVGIGGGERRGEVVAAALRSLGRSAARIGDERAQQRLGVRRQDVAASSRSGVRLGLGAERARRGRRGRRRRRRRRGAGRSRAAAGRGRRRGAGGRGRRSSRGSASASASSTSSRSALAWRSSRTANCGATPASSGKRRSSASQKAWMVWMRSPPGVSSARAKRVRARASRSGGMALAGLAERARAPRAARRRRASPSAPSVRNRRFCISAAAALV